MKYKTIYADPPWNENGGPGHGVNYQYSLMKTTDIKKLPVKALAAESCHLYLWATNNFLKDAFEVINAWGFRYINLVTWFKEGRFGLGQYFMGKTEHCLFAVKGPSMVPELKGITAVFSLRGKHSAKPEAMRAMIERVSPGPRLELFARKHTTDWDVWGNEVDSEITLEAI